MLTDDQREMALAILHPKIPNKFFIPKLQHSIATIAFKNKVITIPKVVKEFGIDMYQARDILNNLVTRGFLIYDQESRAYGPAFDLVV